VNAVLGPPSSITVTPPTETETSAHAAPANGTDIVAAATAPMSSFGIIFRPPRQN
jgi:hypothetical protein